MLVKKCGKCHTPLPKTAKFCSECGEKQETKGMDPAIVSKALNKLLNHHAKAVMEQTRNLNPNVHEKHVMNANYSEIKRNRIKLTDNMKVEACALSADGELIALLTKERYGQKVIFELFRVSTSQWIFRQPFTSERKDDQGRVGISGNGRYAALSLDGRILLIDCASQAIVHQHADPTFTDLSALDLTSDGRVVMTHQSRIVTLYDPDTRKVSVLNSPNLSKVNRKQGEIVELNHVDVVVSPSDLAAVVRGDRNYKTSKEESSIAVDFVTPGLRCRVDLPADSELYAVHTGWFDQEKVNVYLKDKFCDSFCFSRELDEGLALYGSTLVTYRLSDSRVIAKIDLSEPYIRSDIRFKFTKLLYADGPSVFLLGSSHSVNNNPYNASDENEYFTHLIEMDRITGKEKKRLDFNGFETPKVSLNMRTMVQSVYHVQGVFLEVSTIPDASTKP